MKKVILMVCVLSFAGFAHAAERSQCDGKKVSSLGGISNDSRCESGRSFESHEVAPVCITGLETGTGAYWISGNMCADGTLEVTQARPYYER